MKQNIYKRLEELDLDSESPAPLLRDLWEDTCSFSSRGVCCADPIHHARRGHRQGKNDPSAHHEIRCTAGRAMVLAG